MNGVRPSALWMQIPTHSVFPTYSVFALSKGVGSAPVKLPVFPVPEIDVAVFEAARASAFYSAFAEGPCEQRFQPRQGAARSQFLSAGVAVCEAAWVDAVSTLLQHLFLSRDSSVHQHSEALGPALCRGRGGDKCRMEERASLTQGGDSGYEAH